MTDSRTLLAEYARAGSEPAFRELVTRYVNLVYSTALRRVEGDAHRAEDVTQTVFVDLARLARTLSEKVMLGGWLHRHTCFVASNTMRGERRRQLRERQAVEMNQLHQDSGADFSGIAPVLDEAINALDEADRTAILLRFFEQCDFHAVGRALGGTEDAARMRVNRALLKLESLLKRRGVTAGAGAGALAAALSAGAVHAAPANLAAGICTATFAGTAAAVATKAIAMTTLQKTLITGTIAALVGVGVYEASENHRLRGQVQALEQQKTALEARIAASSQSAENAVADPLPQPVVAASAPQNLEGDWGARLLALNTNGWRVAFSTGQRLAALPGETGLALLRANWGGITNIDARQQLLKAFVFAEHERTPAVLELGLLDGSPQVQSWALTYLKDLALQDFTTDYPGAVRWLAAKREMGLSLAFAQAAQQAAGVLSSPDGEQVRGQLSLIERAGSLFTKHREVVAASGLDQALARLVNVQDSQTVALALKAASRLPMEDEWRRQAALPCLSGQNAWEVRQAAASVLGHSGGDWAVTPLLETIQEAVQGRDRGPVFGLATSLSELGSSKAIPTLIGLIEAENTYDTVYGIGYFGLGKITGVEYDEKHDGAWWRQWWEKNKQRFPSEVQTQEIPHFPPVAKAKTGRRN